MVISLHKSQMWHYVQPFFLDDNIASFRSQPEHVLISTEAIISTYWPGWVKRMIELNRDNLISLHTCIQDFLTTNWADELNKAELSKHLTECEDPVRVSFHKKDGSYRVMYCTLNQNLIPIDLQSYGSKAREYEDMLTVYDVEADGWRTINFNGIVEVLEDDHV